MEEQKTENIEKKAKKDRKNKKSGGLFLLHFLQHILLTTAAVLLVTVFFGAYVVVDTKDRVRSFYLTDEKENTSFEDSNMFNSLLGNNITDIICYGAIRGQMETEGEFDAKKRIDVTAFADRYEGIATRYVTADYYLDDLIKWGQAGFEYDTVYMNQRESAAFLNRSTLVTEVDLEGYGGGMISYLNTDLSKATTVREDVSGNGLAGNTFYDDYEEDTVTERKIMLNRYCSAEGKNIEDYVAGWDAYEELCANVKKAAEDLAINYEEYLSYYDYYDTGATNVVYAIRRTIGDETEIFTNLSTNATTLSGLRTELMEQCEKYVFYDPGKMDYETNTLIEEATVRYILNGYEYAYPENTQILIGVRSGYPAEDAFSQGKNEFGSYVPYVWKYSVGAALCIMAYGFLLIVITIQEGRIRRKDTGEIIAGTFREDKIPMELMLLGIAALGLLMYYSIRGMIQAVGILEEGFLTVCAGILTFLASLCFSFFYYSFVRRVKAGILWKESLIHRLCGWLKKWILYAYGHSGILLRTWVPLLLFVTVNVGLTAFLFLTSGASLKLLILLALAVIDGGCGYFLYRSALAKQKILDGITLIRGGDFNHKVNDEGMLGEDLILARAVNSIGESVKEAVETSMKDERLKADLITNVSHDIKTPLTSIINYVDLIKRENVQDAKIREYIEILDSKSQRLKQLTDDLVEASKISSGNIVLQWEKINLVELLNQTIGEFSEKFKEKALYPVFRAPEGSVCIEADSRRIWRVIENLFHNIFKYALEGTRVYIDLALENGEQEKIVILSIKNISAQPLKVNPEELTERFIRGDESRTTEGSGLGLSIAKTLTEAQKGKFEIVMDGDLFKVNLYFPLFMG